MSYEPPTRVRPSPDVLAINCLWSAYAWTTVAASSAAPTDSTGIAANEAIFVPIVVTTSKGYTHGWWYNGSAATNQGNACVAVYNEAWARLATTGAVAASGNSVIQSGAFLVAVTLDPGRYYMAVSYSSGAGATAHFAYASSVTAGRLTGLLRQATGVHPLPDPAVPATWAAMVVPYFGISSFAL